MLPHILVFYALCMICQAFFCSNCFHWPGFASPDDLRRVADVLSRCRPEARIELETVSSPISAVDHWRTRLPGRGRLNLEQSAGVCSHGPNFKDFQESA